MAGVTGLEPAASGVTGQRSNQLSYTPICTGFQGLSEPYLKLSNRTGEVPFLAGQWGFVKHFWYSD